MRAAKFGRVSAAVTHLLISLAIAAVVVSVFWWVWYPKGLTLVAGASELLLLIVGVDVVLGPLLTLILFVPGKKGLYIDISMIALLQTAALVYGVHVMLQTRPVFLVAMSDKLQLVSANDLDVGELAKASRPEYARLSWSGPVLVGSRDPTDPEKFMELTASVFSGGPEIDRRPEYYVAYEEVARTLLPRARRLSSFVDSKLPAAHTATQWAARRGLSSADIAVVPIAGRSGTFAMLVDADTGALLYVFDFHPGNIPPPPAPPRFLSAVDVAAGDQSLWQVPDYLAAARLK